MELILIAVAVASGLELRRAAILTVAALAPLLLLAILFVIVLRMRPARGLDSALLCDAVASELRTGSNLRDALAASSPQIDPEGLTTVEVGTRVAAAHPDIAEEIEATVGAAATGGSRVADLFDEIGSVALAMAEMRREVRVATAPARITVAIFLIAPVAFFVFRLRSGGISAVVNSTDQRGMVILGGALFVFGIAVAVALAWRSK